jgi:hypothetical protein
MYEGAVVCTSCAKQAVGARRGRVKDERRHAEDDEWTTHPYFYGAYHYHGYGGHDQPTRLRREQLCQALHAVAARTSSRRLQTLWKASP